MRALQLVFRAAVCAAFCALLAACGNAGAIEASSVTDTPTPVPTPFNGHLYVEYGSAVGSAFAQGIAVYSIPLSPASTPLFTIVQQAGPLAFDPYGNLYTTTDKATVSEFKYPFSASSTAQTVVSNGPAAIPTHVNDIGFDPNGDLWVLTDLDLRDFAPPFSTSAAARTIVSGGGTNELVFSPSGTMYAGPMPLLFGATATIKSFSSFPYTYPPKTLANVPFGIPMGYFPDGTILVSSTGGNVQTGPYPNPNQVEPPGLEVLPSFSASATVPYIIPFTVTTQSLLAHSGAIDQNGNAYVLDGKANNAIDVFAFPMLAGAKPQMQLACVTVSSACAVPLGVYMGP